MNSNQNDFQYMKTENVSRIIFFLKRHIQKLQYALINKQIKQILPFYLFLYDFHKMVEKNPRSKELRSLSQQSIFEDFIFTLPKGFVVIYM